jgi:hypothetical protein
MRLEEELKLGEGPLGPLSFIFPYTLISLPYVFIFVSLEYYSGYFSPTYFT